MSDTVAFTGGMAPRHPLGFSIVCRSAAGLNEHAFADAQSTAETASLLPLLGWRLHFGDRTDAVRNFVPVGRART